MFWILQEQTWKHNDLRPSPQRHASCIHGTGRLPERFTLYTECDDVIYVIFQELEYFHSWWMESWCIYIGKNHPIWIQYHPIWVNYNISLTWIKFIWGWFPLLTMISSEGEQWGRYNLPRFLAPETPVTNRFWWSSKYPTSNGWDEALPSRLLPAVKNLAMPRRAGRAKGRSARGLEQRQRDLACNGGWEVQKQLGKCCDNWDIMGDVRVNMTGMLY